MSILYLFLKNTPKFKIVKKYFIFQRNINNLAKKICEFILQRNPPLYENIISVFFPARLFHVDLKKQIMNVRDNTKHSISLRTKNTETRKTKS